ncbi:glycerate kinase [Paenibacillus chitinolyticus]|uniref:glycerate kinase n=1 Tax=Paenibacillus chitinolyticus TaxID=79263 RepID=UPI001C46DEA6|nr:glycerate kinase [Paenibacillus chitinolyticus]MBV6715171.1 glycerate kinase [Paenibacillus chitinolyticus]
MKIVIAPDSYKGSLSSKEAGLAIERGVRRAGIGNFTTSVIPMADGGEGTLECLMESSKGRMVRAVVKDPLGRDISAVFGILGDGRTGVIEMAKSSGLYLLEESERNPLLTSTYGFGQLIKAALDEGCRHFILGLGGSATNDGGAGMLQALGAELLDSGGRPLADGAGGGALGEVAGISVDGLDKRLARCTFTLACDVTNPFTGPHGASAVFGPQKGAAPDMVDRLESNLARFADVIREATGTALHGLPAAGAAGGLAGGILAFLNARLESGFSVVSAVTGLEAAVKGADLVLTGEGRTDAQTARGKTPAGVAGLAAKHGVPAVVLAGSVGEGIEELYGQGVTAVFSLVNGPMSLEEAMRRTPELLEQTAAQVMRVFAVRK